MKPPALSPRVTTALAAGAAGLLATTMVACGPGSPAPGSARASVSTPTPRTTVETATGSTTTPAPAITPPVPTHAPATHATPPPAPSDHAPGCTVADLTITTTTDRTSYPQGQVIQITTAVRNASGHRCVFASPGDFSVVDPGGRQVFVAHLAVDCPPAGCTPLAPGQSNTYPLQWNQRQGGPDGPQAPAGTYRAQAAFSGHPVSRSANFTVQPPAAPACSAADLSIATSTDRATYVRGQAVQIVVAVRNASSHGCVFVVPGDFSVVDPGGRQVFVAHLAVDCPPAGCAALAPNQTITYPLQWNQRQGGPDGPQAAAGSYRAQVAFSGYPASQSPAFRVG